jgi:hypothetical protein
MPTRKAFIERVLRQIYNGHPPDDANITTGLVSAWLNDAIGLAAKQCYVESVKLDGIAYVNDSFYTRFKGLSVVSDERFLYKVTLPQVPIGLGRNEAIASVQFKDGDGQVSLPCIPLSSAQRGYYQSLKPIPNKICYYTEGAYLYAVSALPLHNYTAQVSMVSAGLSSDLDSPMSVPDDYFPVIVGYIREQLLTQKAQPQDVSNDGQDIK